MNAGTTIISTLAPQEPVVIAIDNNLLAPFTPPEGAEVHEFSVTDTP